MLSMVGLRPHLLPRTDLDGSDAVVAAATEVDAPSSVLGGDSRRD